MSFSLYDNLLSGTIPTGLSALADVEYFALSTNKLSGSVPADLGARFSFCFISAHTLYTFCHIPVLTFETKINQVGPTFHAVKYFDLNYNLLSGSIPQGVRNMSRVSHLVLSNNHFTGSLGDLSPLRYLEYVDTSANRLTGAIPDALCLNPRLAFCALASSKYRTNVFDAAPPCIAALCSV